MHRHYYSDGAHHPPGHLLDGGPAGHTESKLYTGSQSTFNTLTEKDLLQTYKSIVLIKRKSCLPFTGLQRIDILVL